MMKLLKALLLLAALGLAYLLLWPVPVEPVAWDAPKDQGFKGVFKVNSKLANFEALTLDGLHGPEAVTTDRRGNVYTTTHQGWILRWRNASAVAERWVNVGGRPLGIALDAQQNLWVANAYLGLQKVTQNGEVTVELDTADGVPIRYADDLVVVPNGKVYFSDASTKFSAEASNSTLDASLLAILEHSGDGRVIEFNPSNGEAKVIMKGLTFSNGVTASADGQYILVAETGSYKIWKYWLKGPLAGNSEVIIDNLPGFPDNVHRGQDGRYWIGLTTIRADVLDDLSAKPFMRKVVQRLPSFMRPNVEPYGHVLAINGDGEVLVSLQDPKGTFPATTGAWETDDYLFVSSLTAPVLARYSKQSLGL